MYTVFPTAFRFKISMDTAGKKIEFLANLTGFWPKLRES